MKTISIRNVHDALPVGLQLLKTSGIERNSRNGKVLVMPDPVTTIYHQPQERVIFWPERDANPFFHLYESLWMLAGRNDVASLARFVKRIEEYSDDGKTLHDAYGYRWRSAFSRDQLSIIAERLRSNPDDRRCVLQMWDASLDLDRNGKAVPCNTIATFQLNPFGKLDLTVFCRSNDIIWGAYGANAVQFGTLLEYMAAWIGCPIGTYYQISVNWHAYLETMDPLLDFVEDWSCSNDREIRWTNPYETRVRVCPLVNKDGGAKAIHALDFEIGLLLHDVSSGFRRFSSTNKYNQPDPPRSGFSLFILNAYHVFMAHERWRQLATPERFDAALDVLESADQAVDWVIAAREWILRRRATWELKLAR